VPGRVSGRARASGIRCLARPGRDSPSLMQLRVRYVARKPKYRMIRAFQDVEWTAVGVAALELHSARCYHFRC